MNGIAAFLSAHKTPAGGIPGGSGADLVRGDWAMVPPAAHFPRRLGR